MTTGLGALVQQPLWRRWAAASFLGRLPMTMTLLALILVGREATGSLAIGAQLAGVATATAGLAAPLRGRQLDQAGLRDGLRRAAFTTAGVLLVIAGAVHVSVPTVLLYVLAALLGGSFSALSGGFRALLVPVVSADDLPRANTLEAVFIEVAFVAGPSLAGIFALVVGPVGVLVLMAAAAVGSGIITGRLPSMTPHVGAAPAAPWRSRGAPPVYALALLIGACLGLLESALPARAEELGMAAAAAGPLLALTAAGSAVGGLFAATRRDQRHHQIRVAVALLVALGVLLVGLALADAVLPLGIMLFVVGAPIAPLNAVAALRLQDRISPARLGEGFAVFTAAIMVGAGIGQSITGQLLDTVGPQVLLVGSAAVPVVGAMVVSMAMLHRRRRVDVEAPAQSLRG
ncbi:MAG: hypothetical protein GEU74_03100 [Nitriliruptorales bacterium]|nr:hypothetical protein [Nitriliruptorales bacterium]